MLQNMKKLAFAATMTAFGAQSAAAEEHVVIITGSSFFPQVTYVDPSDTVRFVNESSTTQSINGQDGNWEVLNIPNGGAATLTIVEGMKNQYTGDGFTSAETGETITPTGSISFANPPLGSI